MPTIPSTSVDFIEFIPGDTLGAADLMTYCMDQSVMTFINASLRDISLHFGVVSEGMVAYVEELGYPEFYDGTSWVRVGRIQDVTSADTSSALISIYMR